MKKRLREIYNSLVLPWHYLKGWIAGLIYGLPARNMIVVGVTGTNGKTTTCFMLWRSLRDLGVKAGVMTTVGYGVEKIERQVEHMTTASPFVLNRRIAEMKKAGVKVLVLEVTSHALTQNRVAFVPFKVAVGTNVTREHLDYHRTFERYVQAKARLFGRAEYLVVNADDRASGEFLRERKKEEYITYGIKNGQVRAEEVKLEDFGVKYAFHDIFSGEKVGVRVGIPGEFNVYNSLAAICAGRILGEKTSDLARAVGKLEEVPGRMHRIDEGQDFGVIVDYAHTPDAFLKAFRAVEGAKRRRIITVTGGAGRRDSGTRTERGAIAAEFSEILIVTEDDSRDEKPIEIAKMFVEGAVKAGMKEMEELKAGAVGSGEDEKNKRDTEKMVTIELNRKKAINLAINLAKKGDLVMILGRGHERTMLVREGAIPFDDVEVAREAILGRMRSTKKTN